ncbi:MAG TPA: GNAT family N-acetyltransferase [Chloroflexota bacterium]
MTLPRVEVRHLRDFSQRDHEQLAALRGEIDYGIPPHTWTASEDTPWRVLLWDGDRLASHVGILEREIRVGDRPLTVAGIRSVMTLPALRGRGYASMAVSLANDFIAGELPKSQFALLICLDTRVALYRRLGYELVREPTVFEQPGGPAVNPINTMVRPFRGRAWPSGRVDLCGLPW